jgi:predicted nucleic acid-binding protein
MKDRRILDIYTFDKRHYRRLEGIRVNVPGEEGI